MILVESLVVFFVYLIGMLAALHAVLRARDPRSAVIWLAICLLLPLLGALLYALLGINRVSRVTQTWHSHGFSNPTDLHHPALEPLDKILLPADWALLESGSAFLKTAICQGCQITPLIDTHAAYQAMLAAIEAAKDSIYLVTYIFSASGAGAEIIEALQRAIARKVEVKVLIDGLGSLYSWPQAYHRLKRKKVPVRLFLSPLRSLRGFKFLNLRCHSKIMVVDGRIGFTGGMNIVARPLHDLHFQCEGAIVGTLQDVFLNMWYFSGREYEPPRLLFYDDSIRGSAVARGIDNGPYQDFSHLSYRLSAAINQARHHIRIMTPYFVVGSMISSALINACFRGVSVEIILPEKNNLSFVKGATEAILPLLLTYGVKFYYRQGAFAHSKIVIVDETYVLLGSSNLDTRSLFLNFEFNLEVYDRTLASQLITHFEAIQKHSREITNSWLQAQSFIIKLRNAFCKLCSPYL